MGLKEITIIVLAVLIVGGVFYYRKRKAGLEKEIAELRDETNNLRDEMQRVYRQCDEKMQFLNNMAHDIRTPVNGIMGMTSIAAFYADDEKKVRECLNKVAETGNNLMILIDDVLNEAKADSDKNIHKDEEFSIIELVHKSVEMTDYQRIKKNQEFNLEFKQIIHERVKGDGFRIRQIFYNIIANAVKYTPDEGNINVSLSEKPLKDNLSEYVFVCEDNGYGMKEEFLRKIFIPFERAEDETIAGIFGTGLGMSIVKKSLDSIGGSIDIESEYGAGSKFTIRLKLIPLEAEESASKTESEEKHEEKLKKVMEKYTKKDYRSKRILLVEDDELNREVSREILELTGAAVSEAENGRQAVEKFGSSALNHYDMIIMDIKMPVMGGIKAAEEIRKLDRSDAGTVPIIAVSANRYPDETDADSGSKPVTSTVLHEGDGKNEGDRILKSLGFDGFFIKPLNMSDFLETMEAFFEADNDSLSHENAKQV